MAAYEVLLLNTTLPQIQAAQAGDTYVVPRDITFSTNATFTTGTANGVMYLNGDKVVSTGSLLTFNGTTFTAPSLSLTNALSTTSGGTGLSSFTAGDLTYYSTGTALSKLAIGTANQVLTSSGTAPQWTSLSSIGVTSVSFGSTGLTPSSATAGAVSVAGTLVTSNGGTGLSSYTAGDLVYYSTGTALSKLAIGTASQILTSSGSAPQWSTASGISVGTATNLAGGAAGSVPYQSGAGATTFLSIGAANRVLTSTGSAPQWVTSLTGLTGVSSSSITNTALTSGRVVYSTTGGAQTDSASLTFDGTTLTAGGFSGPLNGTVGATTANTGAFTTLSASSTVTLSGGTANGVLYLNGSKVATSGSALTFDGTTFAVTGAATVTGDISTTSTGRVNVRGSGTGVNYDFQIDNSDTLVNFRGSRSNAVTKAYAWYLDNSITEGMRLTSTGLGIGTSSPAYKLEVVAPSGDNITALFRSGDATAANNAGGGFRSISSATATSRLAQVWLDADGANFSGGDYFYIQKNGNSGTADIVQYSNSAMTFATNATERMRLDSSGNLRLGTTSSLSAADRLTVVGGNIAVQRTSGITTFMGDNTQDGYVGTVTNHAFAFLTNSTERARITSGGDFLVGTTTSSGAGGLTLAPNNSAGAGTLITNRASTTSTSSAFVMQNGGGTVGNITYTNTAVAYNTTSDYRLKDNQQPLTNSGAFIDALKPKTWDWRSGGKGVGFIAHEVQAVSPGSVVGTKDAVDEEGKPVYQAMEYGSAEFIANIIAELQSLRARVAQLESKGV